MTTLAKYLFSSAATRSGDWMSGWSIDDLLAFYASTSGSQLSPFFTQTWSAGEDETIGSEFEAIVRGVYQRNGVAAACMFVRLSIFAQMRFIFRELTTGAPGRTFTEPSLDIVRRPWANATTADLASRVINDSDLVGNSFTARRPNRTRPGSRLKRMRPDWSSIMIGVDADPEDVADPEVDVFEDLDAELLGYGYHPGGFSGGGAKPVPLLPEDVAHFAPIPDPLASFRGMSPLTSVLREVQADNQATSHKQSFFKNAATPNLVVTLDISDPDTFEQFINIFNEEHKGVTNAYKTLFFGAGAQVKPVGHTFREMDYKATMAIGETRIAAAFGLSAVIARISEGLQGSALNAGNYNSARRMDADTTFRDLWQKLCGSFEHLVDVPDGAELWYDEARIPFLQEDEKDAAEIRKLNGQAITQLIYQAGFKPDAAVEAVTTGDLMKLAGQHTGKLSVQLQKMSERPDIDEGEE